MDEEGEGAERRQPPQTAAAGEDDHRGHQGGEQRGLHAEQREAHQLGVEGGGQRGEHRHPGERRAEPGHRSRGGKAEPERGCDQDEPCRLRRERCAENGGEGREKQYPSRIGRAFDTYRWIEDESAPGEQVVDVSKVDVRVIHEQAAEEPGGREEVDRKQRRRQKVRAGAERLAREGNRHTRVSWRGRVSPEADLAPAKRFVADPEAR